MSNTEQGFPPFPLSYINCLKRVIMLFLCFLFVSLKIFFYLVCRILTILVILFWAYSSFQHILEIWSLIIHSHYVGSLLNWGLKRCYLKIPIHLLEMAGRGPSQQKEYFGSLFLLLVEGRWVGWNFIWRFLLEWPLNDYDVFVISRSLVFLIITGN